MHVILDPEGTRLLAELPGKDSLRDGSFSPEHALDRPHLPLPQGHIVTAVGDLPVGVFYQVGRAEPIDGGDIGGDVQVGTAWQRRWAARTTEDHWMVITISRYACRTDSAFPGLLREGEIKHWVQEQAEIVLTATLHRLDSMHCDYHYVDAPLTEQDTPDAAVQRAVAALGVGQVHAYARWFLDEHPYYGPLLPAQLD